ncbi:MAG: ATPase domain-containing protein [Candidatus Hermodarchaeia archaeon]
MAEKTKSGIPGLDEALHGGFPPGAVILVSGGPGTGKSILMNQFLFKGATEFKEPGVLVSMEESIASTIRNMKQFGWDLQSLMDKGLIAMKSLFSLIHREIRRVKANFPVNQR